MPNLRDSEVQKLISGTEIKTFVETGTRYGWTLSNIAHLFDSCHSIEINEYWHNTTKNGLHGPQFPNLSERDNITFHLGDSAIVLPELLDQLQEPLLIFLDAHYMSAGPTPVRGVVDVPLYEELDAIVNHPFPDIVVVDDIHVCGASSEDNLSRGADWTNISVQQMLDRLKPKKHWVESLTYEPGCVGIPVGETVDCHLVMET